MFTDTADAVLVRRTFAAFNDGDFDVLSQILAEDIVWEATGHTRSRAATRAARRSTASSGGQLS